MELDCYDIEQLSAWLTEKENHYFNIALQAAPWVVPILRWLHELYCAYTYSTVGSRFLRSVIHVDSTVDSKGTCKQSVCVQDPQAVVREIVPRKFSQKVLQVEQSQDFAIIKIIPFFPHVSNLPLALRSLQGECWRRTSRSPEWWSLQPVIRCSPNPRGRRFQPVKM